MKVEQVYEIVNALAQEALGADTPTVGGDDISKVIDVGRTVFESMPMDNYVKKLVDHIGKMIFVNRPYSGRAPSVRMDGWEFGSILQKVDAGLPEAEMNPSWQLANGQEYKQDIFVAPTDVTVTFWNDRVTFQIHMSFVEDQIKSAFDNINQMNAFFSMIFTKIETAMVIRLDQLIMSTINNFIANVYANGNTAQKINLGEGYTIGTKLSDAIKSPEFIRNAAYRIKLTSDHLTNASQVFNIGKRVRHTPKDMQKIILLDAIGASADIYLQSDTFHNELTKLPNADRVSYWQYSGENYDIEDTSAIDVIPATKAGAGAEVKISGVIGTIFDREALGVNNFNRRTTTHYNGAAEFVNMWFKMDAQYFNDFNENFVLIYFEPDTEPVAPEPNPVQEEA